MCISSVCVLMQGASTGHYFSADAFTLFKHEAEGEITSKEKTERCPGFVPFTFMAFSPLVSLVLCPQGPRESRRSPGFIKLSS